jgi:hypothetical protein
LTDLQWTAVSVSLRLFCQKKEKIKLFYLIFSVNKTKQTRKPIFIYLLWRSFLCFEEIRFSGFKPKNWTWPNRTEPVQFDRFGPFSSKNSSPSSVGILGPNRTMNTPKYRNLESDETSILQHIKMGITNFGFHAQKPG